MNTPAPKKRFRWLKRIGLTLLILAIVAHFATPLAVKSIANKQLPQQLNTEASLGGFHINLLRGKTGVRDLVIEQPAGFGDTPLLYLEGFEARVPPRQALLGDYIAIDHLKVDRLSLCIVADSNGVLNVTNIGPEPAEGVEEETSENETAAEPPALWLKHLAANEFLIHYIDQKTGLDIQITNLNVAVEHLVVGDVPDAPDHGSIHVDLGIRGVDGSASIIVNGMVGSIQPGLAPRTKLALSLTGFELDLVKPVTKTDLVKALGAGLDLEALIEIEPGNVMSNQVLGGEWALSTSAGVTLRDKIAGTIGSPEINIRKMVQQVVISGGMAAIENNAGNVAQAGMSVVGGAAKAGSKAVKGVGKTLVGTLSGLGTTLKGAATLDTGEMIGGLKSTTVGTVTNAISTVTETTTAAGTSVLEAGETAVGMNHDTSWIDASAERQAKVQARHAKWLSGADAGE